MPSEPNLSLRTRLRRNRLWVAAGGAVVVAAAVVGFWTLDTAPGHALARPGDLVERGAPLFAIEASEFVQGQNDLITAVAGVEKARSRLLLAQTAEKRQRELQAIRGGALKDLEQAQSDLVGAQGDLRSAEIALAAVRNRLRILGRSDEE